MQPENSECYNPYDLQLNPAEIIAGRCPCLFMLPAGIILKPEIASHCYPALFNIYVNNVIQIYPRATFVIYAGDTSLFIAQDDYGVCKANKLTFFVVLIGVTL